MKEILTLFIGIAIAALLVGTVVMPTVVDNGQYVYGKSTLEGLGIVNANETGKTILYPPIQHGVTAPIVYRNTSAATCDAGAVLTTGNYSYNEKTGAFNFSTTVGKWNNSCVNVTYTGALLPWDAGSSALWLVVGIAVIASFILMIL